MKKIFLSAAVLAVGFTATAQEGNYGFNEGDVILEGSLGYNSEDNTESEIKRSEFTFTPKAGYFINDKFALGLQLGFGTDKVENYRNDTEDKINTIGFGVFGRYYFAELGQRFKVYSELGVGYTSYKDELRVGPITTSVKGDGFGINAGLGFNYFVTPKIAINFALADIIGYNTYKPENSEATNNFHLNVNNFNNFFDSARFGLTFKF